MKLDSTSLARARPIGYISTMVGAHKNSMRLCCLLDRTVRVGL